MRGHQTCSACTHPDSAKVDADLLGGVAQRVVAQRYGLSLAGVNRHKKSHLSPTLAVVRVALPAPDDLDANPGPLDRLRALVPRTEALLAAAEAGGNIRQALDATRELRATLVELGKATGEFGLPPPAVVINLAVMPEWLLVRRAVMEAMAPYPEDAPRLADKLALLEAASP